MSSRHGPLGRKILDIRPLIAADAQRVYDEWEQDENGMDVGV